MWILLRESDCEELVRVSISNKMNKNINFLLEEVKRKRLIVSRFFIGFPISGLEEHKI